MKKRTSRVSRRIVSLLMSMVLTLTLVTPAAFAAEVVDGSSTTIVEGNANPADPAPGEDSENNEDKNTEDGKDEQPTEPRDEDKNPDEDNGDDASKPDGDSKDKENPDGENKDEENKDEQPTEDENNGEDDISLLNDENGTDVWDGTTDTSWYNYEQTTTFEISTAEQLAGLAQLVNGGTNFSGKTIKLMADIQLNELDENGMPTAAEGKTEPSQWTPIGTSQKKFAGTFDGDGHTITGLYINDTAAGYNAYKGLFGNIAAGAKVQNLIVTGDVAAKEKNSKPRYVGGIVGFNSGTVQNCGFQGSVSASKSNGLVSSSDIGGVVGGGKATNCWYFRKTGTFKLGVCGGTPTNCYQNVSVNSNGTYVADNFAATVANKLNVEAFKDVTLLLWKAVADGYPVFDAAADRDNMVPVTLETYVKASSVVGKIEISVQGSEPLTAYLAKKGDSITLKLVENYPDDGDKIYYTPDKDKHSSDEIVEITAAGVPYTVPMKLAEGQTSVTLYYGTMEEFNAVEGVSAWYYNGTNKITNEAELRFLAALVNDKHVDFNGRTAISIENDIALTETWMPIGTADHPFHGIFNGNGHTISGLKVEGAYANAGLFGVVEEGTVKQVNLRDGKISSTTEGANVGGIAGCIRGESKAAKVESCDSNVEVIAAGKNANAGGIAGTIVGNGSLKYSICTGKVTATGENAVAGGLVGRITDTEKYSGTVQGGYFYTSPRPRRRKTPR